MVTQLDKNVSALRSIDTSFKMSGITSEFQKGLGAEQLSLVNDKLRGDMISLKQDIEQANKNNQPLTADQIKTRINEISEGKKQTLELYDQAVTVFKVESAIQRSVEEMSQLRSATEANLPTARAKMAPRYIPQGRANPQAEQNNDFAKFKNLKYDDKVTQDNPAFAKAIKQDLEFTSRVGDVLDGQIKTSKDQGNDVSKDVALKSKVDELSGVLKSTQSALKSTPEGTIDRAQNQRFADKIEDLKGQITKDHAKDLQKVDASSKQQMMTSIEKNDPRVSTMITQDRYPDPIVADQKYKTIVDQLTQMRANPYKADEYYQKVMPATSELGDLLANPKVRDSMDSVGLRVGRYESSLSSSQSKDLDEKADAIKQNLSRPSLFSELAKESDLDQKTSSSPSLKDLSIAKIDSLKEESKFVKSQFDKLGESKVLSSQEGFSQQIQDLTTEQKKLEGLYGKAQGQIEKGSTLKELDVTMKEIKQTQDSFVAESKAFTDQNLSFVNAKINSNNPNISQQGFEDLNKLNKDLTQLDKQVTALDKAKISESSIDFVAPNRFEKFNESKESIVQGVVQDNLRVKEFQESLQKISDETGDKKLGTLNKDAQGIIESQQQAIKSFQDIDPNQPLNDDKKGKIDDLVFRLEDLNNRQRKLVEDYVKNNSSNPELLESIERAKKTYEFFDTENKAQESKSFKTESVNDNSSVQDQVALYKAEARLEQVAGISKTLISSQISDALISGKISDALLSGKFQDALLKGGLPMIGGALASANPELESQNATKLQTEKKIQQLSLKMDKLNMKLAEQQVTRMKEQMESKDKVSSAEKFEMMAKQSQLKELRESVSKRKSHISKINDQLGNKE